MSDSSETTPQAGESAAPSTPQVTTPQAGDESAQAASSPTQDEAISLQEAKKLRKEAKQLRERLKLSEDKASKLETAQMSEEEKIRKERDEAVEAKKALERRLPELVTGYAVTAEAQKLGVVDSEVVAMLIDRSELEYDDDGVPTNVAQVVKALLDAKPYLRGPQAATTTPPPANAGAVTNPPSPSNTGGQHISSMADWEKADKTELFKRIREGTYENE